MPKRKRAEASTKTEGSPESHDGQDSTYCTQPPAVAECPFTIDYVNRPSTGAKAKKRRSVRNDSDTSAEKVEEDVPSKNLEMAYVIRPGTLWEAMKKYRNFVVGEEAFGVNDFVSINHSNIAHGELYSPEDEKMFWVARVLEVRARDSQNVYLRVFWMYWPEELPMGAQPYHGKHELVASNHMEIIDAMTVASKASVSHWLEKDEEKVLDALYWRQTFDFQTQTLSDLRGHCTCHGFYNPDETLIGCSHPGCNIWMHEQCVISDTLKRTYERLVGDANITPNENPKPALRKGRRKSAKPKSPMPVWEGLFSATVMPRDAEPSETNTDHQVETASESNPEDETDNKSAGKIVVTDLRSASDNDGDEEKVWEEDIICLGCRRKIK